MAFDTQPVLATSFAGGTNGTTITAPASPGYQSLGTADGMKFDSVVIGTGQTATYSTTAVSGLTMMWIAATTTNTCFGMWTSAGLLASAATQQWFRTWVYTAANPASTQPVHSMLVSGTRSADVVINSNGTLSMRDASGTIRVTTTATIPLGQLFRIEGYITSDPSAGAVSLSLYSSPWSATPTETKSATGLATTGGAMTQVRFGGASACAVGAAFGLFGCAVSVTGPIGPGAVVQQMICGAPSSSGFTVISKPTGGTSLRLKVATDSGLTTGVTYVTAQAPDSYGYVKHVVTGLSPYTRYWCQLLDTPPGQSEMAVGNVGTCKTLAAPGSIQSFTFAVGSCINTAYETPVPDAALTDLIAWQADLNICTGDYTYQNPGFTDQPSQIGTFEYATWFYGTEAMTRQAWGYYCQSNHDSTTEGSNCDSNNTWTAANLVAVQEMFPQGTLGDTVNSPVHGLYQSWVQGRVRFIMLAIRNIDRSPGVNTDNSVKTMLGPTQLAWFENQLIQPEPVKIIITDTQWLGSTVPSIGADPELGKWWSYQTERAAIVSYMLANWSRLRNVMLIHGDFHGVAVAVPGENQWGGFPVCCAAPFRQTGAAVLAPGTFSTYYNNAGGECRQYGRVTVTDSGSAVTVLFQGWDAVNNIARVSLSMVFPVAAGNLPQPFRGMM